MKQDATESAATAVPGVSAPVDSDHDGKEWIAVRSCPRCGCHLTRHFACNCGEVHSDYCINCGRFTSLEPGEHVALSPTDAPCKAGPVTHEHPFEEKKKRMDAVHARIREEIKKARAKTPEEVMAVVNRIYGIKTGTGSRR